MLLVSIPPPYPRMTVCGCREIVYFGDRVHTHTPTSALIHTYMYVYINININININK